MGRGAVCLLTSDLSYDNESIPSCFGTYFGEEKKIPISGILMELEFGAAEI